MKKWNLLIDVAKCHNSQNCFLSVADEYQGNTHPGYAAEMPRHGHRWIDTKKRRGAKRQWSMWRMCLPCVCIAMMHHAYLPQKTTLLKNVMTGLL